MMKIRSKFGDYSVTFETEVEVGDFVVADPFFPDADFHVFNKDFVEVTNLLTAFDRLNVNKHTRIVVTGGGTTQDVAAFCCAVWRRGVPWVYYPTTLLSMCDSCIGAKCGINYQGTKNALGLFSAPSAVKIVPKFLETLPREETMSGFGEAFKLKWIDGEILCISPLGRLMSTLIDECLTVKRRYIEEDELERGDRIHLSYGHTLGHAIESVDPSIRHGTAVVLGMLFANFVASRLGVMGGAVHEQAKLALDKLTYGTTIPHAVNALMVAVTKDKKASVDGVTMVLSDGPGSMRTRLIAFPEFESLLKEYLSCE